MFKTVFSLVILLVAVTGTAACRIDTSSGGGEPNPTSVAEFFDAFPTESFSSIEDAERVAGFDILQAGPEFPMAFNQTTLWWFPHDELPVSTTEYTYVPQAPSSMGVTVGVESQWAQKDGTTGYDLLTEGEVRTIGTRTGWFEKGEGRNTFYFVCGDFDGERLWCGVRAAPKLGEDAFVGLISSLR